MSDSTSGSSPDKRPEDSWKEEVDSWARDDWKNADWGKPAAPQMKPSGKRSGGMGSYVEAGPYLSLGMQIAFGMVLFVGLGYAFDQWLKTTPWGMIVGACLGMIGVFYLVVRMAREADADLKNGDRQQDG